MSALMETKHYFLSSTTVLVYVVLTLVLLGGCVEQRARVEKQTIHVTVLLTQRLGPTEAEGMPEELVELLMPMHTDECFDKAFIPEPRLVRLDLVQPVEQSLQLEGGWMKTIQQFFNAQTMELVESNARRELTSIRLDTEFGQPGVVPDTTMAALSEYVAVLNGQTVIVHHRNQGASHITLGDRRYPVQHSIESVRTKMVEELCNSGPGAPLEYAIVYNYQPIGEPPPPPPPPPRDDPYRAFLNWRDRESPAPTELIERLEQLQRRYEYDFRFKLERVRVSLEISQTDASYHEAAWDFLRMAAEVAIRTQDAEEMLDILERDKNDREHGFWKLSSHPNRWNPIITALSNEDVDMLTQSESQGHEH